MTSKIMTIYQFAYNESELIEFVHSEWKKNLPNSESILLDNWSEDNTTIKAVKLGYKTIHQYKTNGFSDETHMILSNNLPFSPKDFVAIVDMDEVCQITEQELEEEIALGTTIIRFEGWNCFNLEGNLASRAPRYDKFCMFNHDKVQMNFGVGRHECYPKGEVKYSKKVYKLLHYGLWDEEYYINRRRMYETRWSEKNLQMNWGAESRKSEQELRQYYKEQKAKAIKI